MKNAYRYSADMYELFSKDTKEPTEDTSSTGLMKPKGTAKQEAPTDSYDPMGFTSGLGSTLRTFFDEEQIKALDSVGLSAQDKRDQMLNEYYAELDMESLARESADLASGYEVVYKISDARGSKGDIITKRLQEDNLELTTSPIPTARPEAEEAPVEIDTAAIEAAVIAAMDTSNVEVDTPVEQEAATTGAGLMSPTTSLSKKTSPTEVDEDVVSTDGPIIADQLRQDVSDVMEPSKTLPKIEVVGDEVPFNQSTSSGSVQGVVKTYKLGDEEKSIIDTSSTAKSDPSLKYPSKPEKINVQNVVMHYTAAEYRNGVRHYMNSFNLRGPSAAYLVTRDGQIYQTFDPTVKGSHVAGSKTKNPRGLITNSNSVGIEVEATDDSPPTKAQLDASAWLSDYIMEKYGAKRVVAHPQANVHKGHVEGYDLVNHWRKRNNLPELEVSKDAIERLFTLPQELETSPYPKPRPDRGEK